MMRTPSWWERSSWLSTLLLPLAWIYGKAGHLANRRATPEGVAIPVICVGNLVAGGAGKTPVALGVARIARESGLKPHFLTRGYGGSLAGPIAVDPKTHRFAEVGDEALLLAGTAPTWLARRRIEGARQAAVAGADLIIMDDGLQHRSLRQDAAILVIDGAYGFGNDRLIPAGPLRESLADALPRLSLAIIIGEDRHHLTDRLAPLPVAKGSLRPTIMPILAGPVVAFAGIGRPDKFFGTLRSLAIPLAATKSFPDHHPYSDADMASLQVEAARLGATLITTEKDWVRLPPQHQNQVLTLPVAIAWQTPADEALVTSLIRSLRGLRRF